MAKKVLVIDDDPTVQRLTEYVLKKSGYVVVTAANGLDGLRKAKAEIPDLIILDVMLPGLDGFEVCERLRQDHSTASIPVLMMSAKAQASDDATAHTVGASEYLAKPASPADIQRRVGRLLNEVQPGEEPPTP
jgi:DNA-binding response OmpR family regulator